MMAFRIIRTLVLKPYWLLFRAHTLGVQAIVLDDEERILLVRHSYLPGWHLPGGGVERNERVHHALIRELREETGVVAQAPPIIHGMFANFARFRGDHIVVFVVRDWTRPEIPPPNLEIREQRLFPLTDLPEDVEPGVPRRLRELAGTAAPTADW